MNSLGNTIQRQLEKLIRIEYCTVVKFNNDTNMSGVLDRDNADSKFWNTVTVQPRHVRTRSAGKNLQYTDCVVLQHKLIGKWYGSPYTPRVGDIVLVLFLMNQKPIILGTVNSDHQGNDPVCRAPFDPYSNDVDARYDEVCKLCQWEEMDFNEFQEAYNYKKGKKPTCDKWYHKSRDWIKIFECKVGHERPCEDCTSLDAIMHSGTYGAHTFFKHFSSGEAPGEQISFEMPPWTDWYHHHCGSQFWFKDSGEIFLENWTTNTTRHGHLYFDPTGTIILHSDYVESPMGSRLVLYSPESTAEDGSGNVISCEMQDLPTNSVVRIYKDGSVRCTSVMDGDVASEVYLKPDGHCWMWNYLKQAWVEINADGDISIVSPTIIGLTAPVVTISGTTEVNISTPTFNAPSPPP
jgi:hypothetical protein